MVAEVSSSKVVVEVVDRATVVDAVITGLAIILSHLRAFIMPVKFRYDVITTTASSTIIHKHSNNHGNKLQALDFVICRHKQAGTIYKRWKSMKMTTTSTTNNPHNNTHGFDDHRDCHKTATDLPADNITSYDHQHH
jgi:hypothetical protein